MRKILTLLLFCCAMAGFAKEDVITVRTARQFIEAIGNDRTIVVDSRAPLNITEALSVLMEEKRINEGHTYYSMTDEECPITTPPSPTALEHVTYAENTDGPTLQIRSVSGLSIRSKRGSKATLLATPRYANVLEFIDSDNISMENLVLGHTEEGYCDKGVIEFDGCSYVVINDCDFFGCGTEGFVFDSCSDVAVNRSTVYDCSYYTMHVKHSLFVRFNDCRFYNNREFEQISVIDSEACFTHCTFDNLQGELFELNDYVQFYGCVFHDCRIEPVASDFDTKGYAILRHCTTAYGGEAPAVPAMKPQWRLGLYTDGTTTYTARLHDDYCLILEDVDGCEGFSVCCVDALAGEYETDNATGVENVIGRLGARLVERNGQAFIVLLDDGGEPVKNLVLVNK